MRFGGTAVVRRRSLEAFTGGGTHHQAALHVLPAVLVGRPVQRWLRRCHSSATSAESSYAQWRSVNLIQRPPATAHSANRQKR